MRKGLIIAAAAAVSFFGAAAAQAGATSGSIWINDPTSGDASTIPAGPADATFNPGVINYQSGSLYTIDEFLNSPSYSNESAAFISGGAGGGTADNIFIKITGTLGLLHGNNSFVVGHDDGAVLSVDGFGTPVNAPGPTSFNNSPFNLFNPGAAENVGFTLLYAECCGAPADLEFTVNDVSPGVPEPATWAMMLVGFGGLGVAMRSRRRRVIASA